MFNPTPQYGGVVIDEAGTSRLVSRSFATPSGIGNTEIVAAQGAGIRIRVIAACVIATTAVRVKFQSAATDITASWPVGDVGGFVLPVNNHGWFQTAANEALNVNLSAAVSTAVQIVWVPAT